MEGYHCRQSPIKGGSASQPWPAVGCCAIEEDENGL